ncbi:MAG: carboxypeptidase regulatory-like domain-containing protein, partial [Candidatus Thermoplasmatota archaeon]|nr:carboxypeptidase regulatory-like domain-containing protein [Candidatus Thermoplasmatota archaeon]
MLKKEALAALLLLNLIVSSVSVLSSGNNQTWWNKEWSFNKEIYIPIDTSDENTKFQPIDIQIDFENSCWAENEKDHSIRVILQDGETLKELESQIYDLVYGDNDHITACNLVFLIPEEANGMEKYYVYYDEEEKPSPGYQDHVDVEESYYRYEPIPGYSFESRYYKITEDGYIVYAVAQEGECTGKGTTQQATKLKTKTKEVMPQNGEVCASFEFWYYYGQGIKEYSSTIEQLISKEIFVDGNLMVEFGIVSGTSREDMQTSVIYKYYYCPTENKRLCTHVRHKTLQECNISPGTNFDGVYTNLQCGGMKSNAIEELNFGEILPYLHVYAEPGILREYALDPDPRYVPDDWNIRVLNTEHDVDLGDEAWACFDKGETGVAHALILGSNSVVTSGTDERDG